MLTIDRATMTALQAHAKEAFPEECCGVVFASPGGQVVRRMTNVQNRLHAADPIAHPRDACTAYHFDDQELLGALKTGDQPGWEIQLFYHSHPEHGAYFSATDKVRALWAGDVEMGPAHPGVAYVVISVYGGAVRDTKVYAWDENARDFVEAPFSVGA